MFLYCIFNFVNQRYDYLFVKIGWNITDSFDIATKELEIDFSLHFLKGLVKTARFTKNI